MDDYYGFALDSLQNVFSPKKNNDLGRASTTPKKSPLYYPSDMALMMNNPYNGVRGRDQQNNSSTFAVRSLLTILSMDDDDDNDDHDDDSLQLESLESLEPSKPRASESASQLAEGTVRALRDFLLEEAIDLHASLRFWTIRWEQPFLSWLEAGPWVWYAGKGYDHRLIGTRVSRIQALLASRCALIGELQQHLLRAGWQKGISQWGVLGGQWALVAGTDPSRDTLAAWSVDAMRLVREQMSRWTQQEISLPCLENWTGGTNQTTTEKLPKWASVAALHVVVSDLSLMADEVSKLLVAMELMTNNNTQLLEQMKPPPTIRRNWYVGAVGVPLAVYVLLRTNAKQVASYVLERVRKLYEEHFYVPLRGIYLELFSRKDRERIIDHKARLLAIESLKKMIKSWLDETYPNMNRKDRERRARNMDMSLIERKKEENMKTIYEINSVVRMSLIEMQFIKKEMMNAMYAMDEMMIANEINMNLAAVTPTVLMLWGVSAFSRFCYYVLLRLGKSKGEIHASFRNTITAIERLLIMRDNPAPLHANNNDTTVTTQENVLDSNDLGMLLLHIHECRNILAQHPRRFSHRRDVEEDLAALSGERGPVSVQQQLRIVTRMCRSYAFIRPPSISNTGVSFDLNQWSMF